VSKGSSALVFECESNGEYITIEDLRFEEEEDEDVTGRKQHTYMPHHSQPTPLQGRFTVLASSSSGLLPLLEYCVMHVAVLLSTQQ
jgi:hypothetical protein